MYISLSLAFVPILKGSIMRYVVLILSVISFFAVTACSQRITDFSSRIEPGVSTSWRVSDVRINIPNTLISTEENSLAPTADIVWHGDPYGDRKQQVALIMDQAISAAASRLNGSRNVIFDVTLLRFHALTPKARRISGGLHKVSFMISVLDARTGEVIVAPTRIDADEFGLTGSEAAQAEAAGQTQKVRISNRIQLVVLNWLGVATANEIVELNKISHIGK